MLLKKGKRKKYNCNPVLSARINAIKKVGVACRYTCQWATKLCNKFNFLFREWRWFLGKRRRQFSSDKEEVWKTANPRIHLNYIWETSSWTYATNVYNWGPLPIVRVKKKFKKNKSTLLLHNLLIDFGFMCNTLIHLCTTSLTKSFRLVWFIAQSKTT